MSDEVKIAKKPAQKLAAKVEELDIAEPKKSYPQKIKMTKPFGFIDEQGAHHYYFQDMVVDVPDQIAEIVDHQCKDFVVG